jgi:hypothetical protein
MEHTARNSTGRKQTDAALSQLINISHCFQNVVDALDAITSDRPYRSASSFGTAVSIIKHESGHQFDPSVVEVFLSIPPDSWQATAKHQQETAASGTESGRSISTFSNERKYKDVTG